MHDAGHEFGQSFSGWVDHIEGRNAVHRAARKGADGRLERRLNRMKIDEEILMIKIWPLDRDRDPPVVPM